MIIQQYGYNDMISFKFRNTIVTNTPKLLLFYDGTKYGSSLAEYNGVLNHKKPDYILFKMVLEHD